MVQQFKNILSVDRADGEKKQRNAQKIHVLGVALIKILGWHCAAGQQPFVA